MASTPKSPPPLPLNQAYVQVGGAKLPIYDPPKLRGADLVNRFTMTTGASKYGAGAFCMVYQDYQTLMKVKAGTPITLVLTGFPGFGIKLPVVVAMAEPMVTNTDAAIGEDDLMKVTLLDIRARNFNPMPKAAYNVMKQDFPQSSGSTACYASTLKSGTPYTWKQIISDSTILASAYVPKDLPTWTPYNLIWDEIPIAQVIDDVAARLFYTVGFDWPNATASNGYGLGLLDPGKNTPYNAQLLYTAQQEALNAGGQAFRNPNRFPGKVTVSFQAYNADDAQANDPYAQRRYTKVLPLVSGGSSDYQLSLHVAENIAIYSGGAWVNQSALDAIATDVAGRAARFISTPFAQYEFAGIWPFAPDGMIREVTWLTEPAPRGARTIIKCDNRKDWLPGDALRDPMNFAGNQEVVGLGALSTAITAGGTKQVWGPNGAQVLVRVTSYDSGDGFYNIQVQKRKTPIVPFTDDQDLDLSVYYQDDFAAVMINTAESGVAGVPALKANGTEYVLATPKVGTTTDLAMTSLPAYECDVPVGAVLVRIDSLASGSGMYYGRVMTGAAAWAAGGDLTLSTTGLIAGDVQVLIGNIEEGGVTGHRLTADGSAYAIGELVGMSEGATPNVPLIFIRGALGDLTRSQVSLSGGTFGSPNTASWDWSTTGHSFRMFPVTNIGYDGGTGITVAGQVTNGGQHVLWFQKRTLTVDARGVARHVDGELSQPIKIPLMSVSVVVDVTIDASGNLQKTTQTLWVLDFDAANSPVTVVPGCS